MIAEKTVKPVAALQDQFLALELLQNEILETEQRLELLQAKFQEIKSGMAMIAVPIQADGIMLTREERVAKAKAEIFTEYDNLLRELAK